MSASLKVEAERKDPTGQKSTSLRNDANSTLA